MVILFIIVAYDVSQICKEYEPKSRLAVRL